MKERPIPFSEAMVRALLNGTKTQTRRVCKLAEKAALSAVVEVPDPKERGQVYNGSTFGDEDGDVQFVCPYGGRGDRLWVRESWRVPLAYELTPPRNIPPGTPLAYQADGAGTLPHINVGKLRPGMFMPRWASRVVLEITDVRVERLQDISEADAIAEGVHGSPTAREDDDAAAFHRIGAVRGDSFPIARYGALWESINGAGSWDANPWVWAVSFRRLP